jgi:hypothetical protein
MIQKEITYWGERIIVACDGKCDKAWGRNSRPKIQLSETDEDDYAYLSDDELGEAPENPGTSEGGIGKPSDHFHNKWCVRECERCARAAIGEKVILPDYSKRRYNIIAKNFTESA